LNLERETKLQAPAGFRLPDLGGDGLHARELEAEHLTTVYVDTPDLRIARWGCSLRHRQGQGWTVKLPGKDEGSMLVRAEHVFPGEDPRRLPMAAADLLQGYVRGGKLAPVARLRTIRRGVEVTDDLGRSVALVTDDEVSVMEGRRVASRFRELEVELEQSAPAEVSDQLLADLRAAGAGEVENVSKLVRALGPRAEEPPDVVEPEVGKDATVAEVVRRAVAASVIRLIRNDAGVRLGDDPEAVHQARVATRRIRSDLRTFRDVVEPTWAIPLREELRWLGGELGAVRDADVLGARVRGREARLASADRPAVERLAEGLDEKRAGARDDLLSSMREPRYAALLDALVEAAAAPVLLADVAESPARAALPPALEGPWKHLVAAIERVREEGTDEALHAARIRAKRVRYAAEAVAPVFGKRAESFAEAAVALQDVLGEHQDAVVASAWLRETAVSTPELAFAAGQLVAIEAEDARTARAAWPSAWKTLSRKKLRFWA
jgi:CHAD domain-containing protein